MKHLRDYLIESERTYKYRIKFVGEAPPDFLKNLEQKLQQFDVVKMSDAKETPVMARSTDFPKYPNDRITMFDIETRYPAIEPQIKQLAQLLGFDPNRIVMLTSAHCDGMVDELERIDTENKDLLADTDYPKNTKEQEELKKDYSIGPYDHAVVKNAYRSDFTIAGGKTPKAKTTNDMPQGKTSPMTNVKRPPRPATGANPRG
jgi:hypothetical protein